MAEWMCARCGEPHAGLPLSYQVAAPIYWYDLPEIERGARATLTDETCTIDDEFFFVRGRIVIPVLGATDSFEWGVWLSLSRTSFQTLLDQWHVPGREATPPVFGWLSSELPYAPSTLNLKTMVHTRPLGERPTVELEPTDHPLAVEQGEGITLRRVREIAEQVLHG